MLRLSMILAIIGLANSGRAEVLDVRRLASTYWTATDTIEVRIEFNRVPELPDDYLGVSLIVDRPQPQSEWVSFGGAGAIGHELNVTHNFFNGSTQFETFVGNYPYAVNGNTWSAIVPYGPLGLSEFPATFNVMVGESRPFGIIETYEGNPVLIDRLVMGFPVPEPRSSALVVSVLLSLAMLRQLRQFSTIS